MKILRTQLQAEFGKGNEPMNKKFTAIISTAALAATLLTVPSVHTGVFAAEGSSETSSESTAISSASEISSASDVSAASDSSVVSETQANAYEESWDTDYEVVDEDIDPVECVEIGNYKGLEVEDVYVAPTDENVDSFITSSMQPEAVEDPEAVAELGDTVIIDYEGLLDGEAFDGGTAENYSLALGSGTFIDGFEDGVVGMKVGEEKAVDLSFPEDYWNSDLAGKAVVFNVTLHEIDRMPELSDEWVASNTEFTTVEEYKASVLEDLEKAARVDADSYMQEELWEVVISDTDFIKVPKSYIDDAAEDFDKVNLNNAMMYGYTTLEEFLTALGVTEDYYNNMKEGYSKDAAKSMLLCDAIWAVEEMNEESEEYVAIIKELEEAYQMTIDEVIEQYGEDTVKGYATTYSVLARILSYAEITVPEVEAVSESEAVSETEAVSGSEAVSETETVSGSEAVSETEATSGN